jgi:hypothetical protein
MRKQKLKPIYAPFKVLESVRSSAPLYALPEPRGRQAARALRLFADMVTILNRLEHVIHKKSLKSVFKADYRR